MDYLRIIGTSHISKNSEEEVYKAFYEFKPDIVAVELDHNRLKSLENPSEKQSIPFRAIFSLGIGPFIIYSLGHYAETKMASLVGVKLGIDIRAGVNIAKENNLPLFLIDRDAQVTIRRLWKKITFKEKFRFLKEIFSAFFKRPKLEFDISKVPPEKVIDSLISKVENDYPSVHEVLIVERNIIMGHKIRDIIRNYPSKKILVIVGAGHKKGLENYLNAIL